SSEALPPCRPRPGRNSRGLASATAVTRLAYPVVEYIISVVRWMAGGRSRRPAPLPYMTEQERTKHYSMPASASPETMPSGDEVSHLRRVLKPRHLTMIAIGGA